MSTVKEIEAALPMLTTDELTQIERAVHEQYRQRGGGIISHGVVTEADWSARRTKPSRLTTKQRPNMPSARRGEVWTVDLGIAAKARFCVIFSVFFRDDERALYAVVPSNTNRPLAAPRHGDFTPVERLRKNQAWWLG